jgi:hypothetical protein
MVKINFCILEEGSRVTVTKTSLGESDRNLGFLPLSDGLGKKRLCQWTPRLPSASGSTAGTLVSVEFGPDSEEGFEVQAKVDLTQEQGH